MCQNRGLPGEGCRHVREPVALARSAIRLASAVTLAVVAYVPTYFPYVGPWRFQLGTVAIIAAASVILGTRAISLLGLKVPVRELGIALVVFLVAWWSARWILVDYVSSYLEVDPRNSLPALVQQTFQVLNDEMVMRAALMTVCLRFVQRTAWAVVSMAAVFALGHVALYGWLGTAMHLSTVITLFSFGVVANTLFVRFGHIAYPFALHLAWNSHRFSTSYALDGTRLSPGQAFNLIEGNPAITSGSVVVMLLVFSLFLRTIPPEVTTCKTLSHAR